MRLKENDNETEYRQVVGFIKYIVSSEGHIISDQTKGKKLKGTPLKSSTGYNGYHHVTLMTDDNRPRTMRVARIVCAARGG